MNNKKTIRELHVEFAVTFATVAGIWAFTANHFNYDEIFCIIIAGAVVGWGVSLIVQVLSGLFRKQAG